MAAHYGNRPPPQVPPRAGAVPPDVMASAIFLKPDKTGLTGPMRFLAAALLSLFVAAPALAASPAAHGHPATPPAGTGETLRLPAILLHGDALDGKPRSLSVEQVDGLAAPTEWTVADPYRQQDVRYRGITLKDLVAAVAPGAQKVRMRAVNDYITVFEKKEWETLPILLATRDNGARMAVANKGPARIVYRQTHENELAMQVNAPKWIWQVVDVEFIGH